MPARFNIAKHKGGSLTHRSRDFLEYWSVLPGRAPGISFNDAKIELRRKNLKDDKKLRPFAISIALLYLIFLSCSLITIMNEVLSKRYVSLYDKAVDYSYLKEDGFIQLNNGNLEQAQCDFMSYQEQYPQDFINTLGLTMTLVSRCELDDQYCSYARDYVAFTSDLSLMQDSYIFSASLYDLSTRLNNLNY